MIVGALQCDLKTLVRWSDIEVSVVVHLDLEDDHHKDAAKSNDFVQDAVKSPDVLSITVYCSTRITCS